MQNVARAVTRHHERIHPKAKVAAAMPQSKSIAKLTKK
jgi:hypothetical protein